MWSRCVSHDSTKAKAVTYLTPTAGVGRPSFPRRPILLTSNRVKRIPLAATPATVAGANVLSRAVCQAHVVSTARCGSVLVRASQGAWSSHYSVEPKPPVVWWWSQIALRDGALMTLVGTVCKPVRPRCGFSATALDASMLPSQRAVIERSPPWRFRLPSATTTRLCEGTTRPHIRRRTPGCCGHCQQEQ